MSKEYEDIVHRSLGNYGLYQVGLNLLLGLVYIPVNWQMLSMNFLAAETDFMCQDTNETNACYVNGTSEPCSGFIHDTSFWTETIRHKWDLICDSDKWYGYANAIFMSGVGVGVVVGGFASDRWGRKPTLFALLFLQSSSALAAAFVDSFWAWLVLRWFTYFGLMSALAVRYVLGMEMLSGKYRAYVGIGFFIFEPIGVVIYPFLAAWLKSSFTLQIAMALANVPIFLMYFIVPESPRWLIRKGRFKEAEAVLRRGAKINRKSLEKNLDFSNEVHSEDETNFLVLFKTPRLRLYTLALIIIWFGHGFIYYGIALNIGELGSDLFTNFVIFGAVDVPAFAGAVINLALFRRRLSFFILMLSTSTLLMLTMAFENGTWPVVAFAMAGKFTLVVTFVGLYLYAGEIYPTLVRNVGLGACSLGARLGSVLGPLTYGLRETLQTDFFPTGFLGCVFLICAVSVLILPETFNKPLPATIKDLEDRKKSKVHNLK